MKGLKGDFSDINLASSLGCRSFFWCVPRNHLYLNVVQAFLYPFNQTREVVREAVAAMRVRSVKFWCRYSRPLLYVIKSLIINGCSLQMWYVVHFGCGGWTLIDAVQAVWLNYAKLRLSLVLRAIIVDLIIEIASGPLSLALVLRKWKLASWYKGRGTRLTRFSERFCLRLNPPLSQQLKSRIPALIDLKLGSLDPDPHDY